MGEEHLEMTAYCGLYCGDCTFKEGTIPDLARDLRKELRRVRFDKVAEVIPFEEFKQYEECYQVLGAMVKLRCKGCRGGGRSKFCSVAKCAIKNGYQGCWECDEFGDCKKLEFLEPVHGEGHKKNLRKIKKVGVDEWAEGNPYWYAPPRKKATS